jgi:hypothetical protein
MKLIFILVFIAVFFSSANAQDFIITKEGSKIECDIRRITHKKVFTTGDDGEEKKYAANELTECYFNGNKFIVAKVPAGTYGVKVWSILKVYVEGDMNLALLSVGYTSKSTFNGTTTATHDEADVFYFFLKGTPNDSYEKIGITWRRDMATLGSSCSEFEKRVKAEDYSSWSSPEILSELVNYFNESCN